MVKAVVHFPSLPGVHLSTEVGSHLRTHCICLLSDEEVRVRIAAGDLLGCLGEKFGISVYEDSKGSKLTSNINHKISAFLTWGDGGRVPQKGLLTSPTFLSPVWLTVVYNSRFVFDVIIIAFMT